MKKVKKQGRQARGGTPALVGNIGSLVLIALLLPILIANVTLVAKSYAKPDRVPTFFGAAYLVVQSGSMEPALRVDDLIFVRRVAPGTVMEGDIVTFLSLDKTAAVTHRIVGTLTTDDGERLFITKGDANNVPDSEHLHEDQIVGRYWWRIGGLGKVALFLMQPAGLVISVSVPLMLFLAYDVLRRQLGNRKKREIYLAEMEELERLRSLASGVPAEQTDGMPAED